MDQQILPNFQICCESRIRPPMRESLLTTLTTEVNFAIGVQDNFGRGGTVSPLYNSGLEGLAMHRYLKNII